MMTAAELKQVFEKRYTREDWINVLREVFLAKEIHANPSKVELKDNRFDARAVELGHFETAEGLVVGIYEVTINPEIRLEHNKVGLRNLMRNVYTHDVDAALIVFSQEHAWRFTYVSEITVYNKETGKREKRKSDPKRYTYIFGRHQLCRTAAERFAGIKARTDLLGSGISVKEIEKAFSVDLLTKDFYRELSNWYFWALQHVEFPEDAEKNQEVRNSTNTIRLITRLIFVWFLKQKGLVPEELFDPEKISPQLNPGYKNESLYYKAILQNLFFATLNQEMGKRGFRKGKQHYNITNLFRYEKYFKKPEEALELFKGIPFLNGGLFECLDKPHPTEKTPQGAEKIVRVDGFSDRDDNPVSVPDYLFFGGADAVDLSMVYEDKRQKNVKVRGLIDILNSYNFTVEENTPLDIQVALDPELLGKVFENLLASYNPETKTTARKQTGSFYTPREIVQYMVDESLIAYLKQKINNADDEESEERKEALLRELLSYSGNGNPFDPEETRLLIEAIDQVKVLDPASGSGAFPMGVLQQLVHILQKLDPDNTEWKKIQMQKAQAELQETIARGDADNFSERIKEIAESFENNTEDYGRKLFLIENCIYGVDIQPIAVQIAKLRFFVSLLCEQTIQEEKENMGIKALPNLETKFVAADTLIALEKPVLGTGNLFLSDTQTEFEKLKKALNENRHTYFIAKRREQKLKCHKIDKEIREKIAKLLVNEGWKTEIAKQVASYDPYDQNQHTDWFDPEWMLGVIGGFDVVIGNPPYISANNMSIHLRNKFNRDESYRMLKGKWDIYVAFMEKSLCLLNPRGVFTFIIPYGFLNQPFAEPLRKYILDMFKLLSIVDLHNDKIFENATVPSCIPVIQNIKYQRYQTSIREYISAVFKEKYKIDIEKYKETEQNMFRTENLNLLSKILSSIKKDTVRLDNYFYVSTGAEIHGKESRDFAGNTISGTSKFDVLSNEKKPGLKPYIEGSAIKKSKEGRYSFPEINTWLDYSTPDSMRSPKFIELFECEKIIVRRSSGLLGIIAIYDKRKIFTSEKCLIVINRNDLPENHNGFLSEKKLDLKYLLGIINSRLVDFYYKSVYGGFIDVYPNNLKLIPIKVGNQFEQNLLSNLIDFILFKKQHLNSDESNVIDNIIDAVVYNIYFSQHMKDKEIDVLTFVSNDIEKALQKRRFELLPDLDKRHIIELLSQSWSSPESEVFKRIELFKEKSPNILKSIIES